MGFRMFSCAPRCFGGVLVFELAAIGSNDYAYAPTSRITQDHSPTSRMCNTYLCGWFIARAVKSLLVKVFDRLTLTSQASPSDLDCVISDYKLTVF